ncbi:hypothetical protein [Pseudovibrio sp. Tun.PSC04-5.I4]|uniref:hypothetical protein n=1 Tax=Pseudovibrio sp. Tun.PSC04-5.I4 TaxID=1798213 RepID=UPI00088B15F0|nr:hypothetical protein [Pseudovibrio sp. Tun.PSC04-5.I4]SDR16733.1 hypothetical protein SAMN04515695_3136 [Pseudovibrio sp. Tun.PSC04-5.I4]
MCFFKLSLRAMVITSTLFVALPNGAMAENTSKANSQEDWCGPCKMIEGSAEASSELLIRKRKAKKIIILPDPRMKSHSAIQAIGNARTNVRDAHDK